MRMTSIFGSSTGIIIAITSPRKITPAIYRLFALVMGSCPAMSQSLHTEPFFLDCPGPGCPAINNPGISDSPFLPLPKSSMAMACLTTFGVAPLATPLPPGASCYVSAPLGPQMGVVIFLPPVSPSQQEDNTPPS